MRRVFSVAALVGVAVLGFGAAFVLAGKQAGTPGSGEITICHATGSETNPFNLETPDASSIVAANGHGSHPDDIIPPFVVIENGVVTINYPGMNMSTIYGAGHTGAEVLANGCDIPTGGGSATTETVTSTTTTTVPVIVTVPATTVTAPGDTTTTVLTVTVQVPGATVTAPGTTTVVTVPPSVTTTVTLPSNTVTLPAATVTLAGVTVTSPPETVTLPGNVTTVTGSTTTTVVTVTSPNQTVPDSGVLGSKAVKVTVTTPSHVVHIGSHVVHAVGNGKVLSRRLIVVVVCPKAPRNLGSASPHATSG